MATKDKKPRYKYVTDEPSWEIIKIGMKPVQIKGNLLDYNQMFHRAAQWVHTEIDSAELTKNFIEYVFKKHNDREARVLLKKLPDYKFAIPGKYAFMINRGTELPPEYVVSLDKLYAQLLAEARAYVEQPKEDSDTAPATNTARPQISIQQRMREQVTEVASLWEERLDSFLTTGFELDKFDPYSDMKASEMEIKPAHAKILQDMFLKQLDEAKLVVEFKDEDIKEGYGFLNAKQRKEFLGFFNKIREACHTIITTGKATRKPRVKKAPTKEKLIAKLKFKVADPELALSSINPISIIGAEQVWCYNTKTRKLMVYVADPLIKSLSVKNSTIVGFDTVNSVQKTVRKPTEQLKGIDKLPRTKMQKLFESLTTVQTQVKDKLTSDTLIIKAF